MVVGMGVVFLVLILLALATGLLEMLFRPSVEREPDLPSQASTETRNESTRRTVALVAVGLYLEDREQAHVYEPIRKTGEQWKHAGRLKSLRG